MNKASVSSVKECLPHCGARNTLCKDTCIKGVSKNLVVYVNQASVKTKKTPKTQNNALF